MNSKLLLVGCIILSIFISCSSEESGIQSSDSNAFTATGTNPGTEAIGVDQSPLEFYTEQSNKTIKTYETLENSYQALISSIDNNTSSDGERYSSKLTSGLQEIQEHKSILQSSLTRLQANSISVEEFDQLLLQSTRLCKEYEVVLQQTKDVIQ